MEVNLVRLLICLFAYNTGIIVKGIFQEYLRLKTHEDGSDLAFFLTGIFNILNAERNSPLKNIVEQLNAFT